MNAAEVIAAAEGADLIVHGANPPGYQELGQARPAHARQHHRGGKGRRRNGILFPGTVYNYGPGHL